MGHCKSIGLIALGVSLCAVPVRAQSTFDACGTLQTCTTSPCDVSGTVGAGANRAMVAMIGFVHNTATSVSLTWDNGGTNQAMTAVTNAAAQTASVDHQTVTLYGLVAPTSGAKTLRAAWTTNQEMYLQECSWSGVDQTGGTTTFAHGASATGNSNTPSLGVTSATSNATMSGIVNGTSQAINSVSATQTYLFHGVGAIEGGGSRAAGAATVTMTGTLSGTDQWAEVGVDLVRFTGGGSTSTPGPSTLALMGFGMAVVLSLGGPLLIWHVCAPIGRDASVQALFDSAPGVDRELVLVRRDAL